MKTEKPYWEKSLATHPLKSYRYKSSHGQLFTGNPSYIMIGTKDKEDAVKEVKRSTDATIYLSCLQVWDGEKYINI